MQSVRFWNEFDSVVSRKKWGVKRCLYNEDFAWMDE